MGARDRWPYARRLLAAAVAASAAAHLALAVGALPVIWRTWAVLVIGGFAPGLLLIELILPAGYGNDDSSRLEKVLYGLAAGYVLLMVTALALAYLPGGIAPWQPVLVADAITAGLALTLWRRTRGPAAAEPAIRVPDGPWPDRRSLWAGVLLVVLIGAAFRFASLGYSEFQGDEARVMLRASEAIEGYENAVFAHQKMPGEILLATSTYAVTRQTDEAAARLPFALAGAAALVGMLLLGARLFGPVAGLAAALLAALTGYFVAFARIVQYQSLVLLAVVLTVLMLWRMLQAQQVHWRYLAVAALLMVLGVLSHYEAAGILAPALYILWRLLRGGVKPAAILRAAALPAVIFLAPALLFVIPFVRYPGFGAAYAYAVGYRVSAGGFPHNNLVEFVQRSSLYGTAYYLLLLTGLTVVGLLWVYARALPRAWAWVAGAAAVGALTVAAVQPGWLVLGGADPTWLLFALLMAGPWLLPRVPPAERLVWWWFGSLLLVSLFVVQRPNSHVYTFFVPWVLLGGMGVEHLWQAARRRGRTREAAWVGAVAGIALLVVFGYYLHRLFVHHTVEVLRTWPDSRPALYWMPFDSPPEVAIFGFPHSSGWKAVGALYAQGALQGSFVTNEKPEVVDWYTRGAGACPRGGRYYLVASRAEPQADAQARALAGKVAGEYALSKVITVGGEGRLGIFDQPGEYAVESLASEAYAPAFDAKLSGPHFAARRGRVLDPASAQPLAYRIGEGMELLGFDLDRTAAAPGEALNLTLYWRALRPTPQSYTVFNQVIDLDTLAKAGQVDGMPACDRNPTDRWFAGDVIEDAYTIVIAPDARPGVYSLITGMYDATTGERLAVRGPDGRPLGSEALLAAVEVR